MLPPLPLQPVWPTSSWSSSSLDSRLCRTRRAEGLHSLAESAGAHQSTRRWDVKTCQLETHKAPIDGCLLDERPLHQRRSHEILLNEIIIIMIMMMIIEKCIYLRVVALNKWRSATQKAPSPQWPLVAQHERLVVLVLPPPPLLYFPNASVTSTSYWM